MRNVVGEMKQRMHPKIERFTTGCKALGESKKRQLVGMLAGKEYVSGITVIELVLILVIIIALLVIFKEQLIDLLNTIFEKITSEVPGSEMKKGEITVFLSLTVVLLVSFILGMMNAANIQLMKNQARIDVDSALYSLFGEYQTDLLEEYHIFGIEETYGTGNLQEENLLRRMHYFGTKGIVHEIKGIQYLTDLDGMGLREQIITYMEQKYGIEYARNLAGMTGEWEEVEIQEKEAKENQNQSIEEMKQMSEEMEKDHQEEIENPLTAWSR